MVINTVLLEKSVNKVVEEVLEQISGELNSTTTLQEAIVKLGVVSTLIMNLNEQAVEEGLSREVIDFISNLKKNIDHNIENVFNKMLNIRGGIGV